MIYLAAGELIVIAALVAAFVWTMHTVEAADERREQAWRDERIELLERIQRPERLPASQRPPRRPTDDPRDRPGDLNRLAQVGTVTPPQFNAEPDGD